MALSSGTSVGPYEILGLIGAGGMGEVYKARDRRLGRDVAIKFAGERFTDRFEHEARAIAALNHPNICTLYDVGPNYFVTELVEGDTLRDCLWRGLSIERTSNIARQIHAILHDDPPPIPDSCGEWTVKPQFARLKHKRFGIGKRPTFALRPVRNREEFCETSWTFLPHASHIN